MTKVTIRNRVRLRRASIATATILLFLSVVFLVNSIILRSSAYEPSASAGFETAAGSRRTVLYVTHSAGFKHSVLPLSEQILKEIGPRHGFDVTSTDDCSLISRDGLRHYDAVVFYTTGELPMSDEQKAALLEFVKSGKG